MIDRVIKMIIIAAIESFPIDENKKSELLLNIINTKNIEEAGTDVL